ncbi:Multidrug resistance-associated protein 4 [Orchesella cincta]|uniref:Multidrug resistance-associated protein 4 n=1 Tax=Orchesella cincta TaxID=48709 RepID=A0A1D2NA38_ORCCI|nr:Multidrug resistance-associated protein 4 [Orchesella cincta]
MGNKRDLQIDDIYQAMPNDKSKRLGDRLAKEWDKELKKSELDQKGSKKKLPSLGMAIVREFGPYFMGVGLLAFVEECGTRIAQPLMLGYLIRYFTKKEEFNEADGYLFAGAVVFASGFYTFTHHPYFFGVQHVGMKIRIACCALVYRKSLRLSQTALGKTNVGQLTNLLSNDVNRFDQSCVFLHYLWVGPIQTAIVTYILWGYYGPSCLAGLFVLVLFVPFQAYCGKLFSGLRTSTATKTDKRIRVMNEIVSGMRVIKMYTWEKPFAALVNDSRKDEVKVIRKTSRLRAVNMSLFYTSSKLIIFLTLLVYVLTDHTLTAEKVFVTLSLYNNVRLIMTLFFPNGVSQLAETLVSIKRLQNFLLMEERPSNLLKSSNVPNGKEETLNKQSDPNDNLVTGVFLQNVSAKWSPEYAEDTLSNVSLKVQQGELVAVIGHVGCGKGSLLHAILKELPASSGSVVVNGSVAYTSQEPWVFAGSVRHNILFGKEFDPDWYEKVITACALKRDMELFPAVYADADVYLLDDPLSAVDAEVGRHLFEKCICGILEKKARILVTHQLQFLKSVNHIMLMDNGKIQVEGNYTALLTSGIDFAQLLQTEEDKTGSTSNMSPLKRTSFGRSRTLSNSSVTSITSYGSPIKRSSIVSGEGSLLGNAYTYDDVSDSENEDESISPDGSPSKISMIARKKSIDGPNAVEETKSAGSMKLSLYWKYFKFGSGTFSFFLMVLFNILTQILFSGADWWLNFWTKSQEEDFEIPVESDNPLYELYNNTDIQVYTYSGIIVALFAASMLRTLLFFSICMTASVNLHDAMFKGIIRSPIRFFEIFLNVIGILVIVGLVNPILLAPAAVLFVIFYFLRRFYLRTARSVKRLEGVARSPVFSHLTTSLYGLTTIRAFEAEEELCKQFDDHQDMHTSSWFLFIATTRWFGIWLDWLSVVFIAFVAFSFMLSNQDGAQVGLAVSSAMMLTGMLQWGVRQSAEVENQMVSVERVMEYTKIEPEAALESTQDKKPPKDWPKNGEIIMRDVQLGYGDDAPVLKNITCTFKSKEKVGIVGRTGAGKSSLITALFRIAEPTGLIEIDGIDVLQIGLHDLRSKVSIIPQDPVLFTGTLRKNLDPFNNYSDEEIWRVLEEVHLADEVRQTSAGISVEVTEGGGNFSVGQRQLVCLGRAILRKNRILVLDEATANVDPETDALIQKTIRTKFLECTVLTVAHRLHTVIDSDKVLVLDAGCVKEYDDPYILLQDRTSALYSLVQQTGSATADALYKVAKDAHLSRRRGEPLSEEVETAEQ